jgi:L-asparaginase II
VLTTLQALLPQKRDWAWATDGCALPSYSFTLVELVQLAGALAQSEAGQILLNAMAKHPLLISGAERFDTVVMEAVETATGKPSTIISKTGAEGMVLLWHQTLKEVAVIKVISGDSTLRDFSTIRLMRQWGWLGETPFVLPYEADILPTPYATIPNTFFLSLSEN